jgi:hypothetical protein
MATASSLQIDGHDLPPTALDQLKWSWTWKSRPWQVVCFERFVAVERSDTKGRETSSVLRDTSPTFRQSSHSLPGPHPHCSTVVELRRGYLCYCGRACRTERDLPFYEMRRARSIQCQCLMINA